jgi:hypothetical protein
MASTQSNFLVHETEMKVYQHTQHMTPRAARGRAEMTVERVGGK